MTQPAAKDDNLWRSVISLVLVIHLFCVGVVLASNFRRSVLQSRLVSIFAAYTRSLDFDPDFTPYFYTLGRVSDDDTWLAIDLYASADQSVDQQSVALRMRLPEGGSRWLEERRRAIRLAKLLAERAESESDVDQDTASEIARTVGRYAMQHSGNKRAVIRVVRRLSQPYDLSALNPGFPPERPLDPVYEMTVYEADAWIDEDNQVQVLRRASRAEVAPRASGGTTPGSATEPDQRPKP
jgi:hypothetical protein